MIIDKTTYAVSQIARAFGRSTRCIRGYLKAYGIEPVVKSGSYRYSSESLAKLKLHRERTPEEEAALLERRRAFALKASQESARKRRLQRSSAAQVSAADPVTLPTESPVPASARTEEDPNRGHRAA